MAKQKKTYHEKVEGLLEKFKEKGINKEDLSRDSRYGMEGCYSCKNFELEKEYCKAYDCNPYELEEEEGIFVEDYCDEFDESDKSKEAKFTGKLRM